MIWLFPIAGIIILLVTVIKIVRRLFFMLTSEVADGEIMEYLEREIYSDNQLEKVYHPVVRFQMKNGLWEEQTSNFGSSMRQGSVGTKVGVFYKPDHPEDFMLRAGLSSYLTYTIVLIMGSFFCSIGYFLLRQ